MIIIMGVPLTEAYSRFHELLPLSSHTSIRGLPKDWRSRPGRPRHTWLRTLEADLQPLNHGMNSPWRHAQDGGYANYVHQTQSLLYYRELVLGDFECR